LRSCPLRIDSRKKNGYDDGVENDGTGMVSPVAPVSPTGVLLNAFASEPTAMFKAFLRLVIV
jgi:hypothetical protein